MPQLMRILALLVLGALCANMQCYARCIASAQTRGSDCHDMGNCHHSPQKERGQQPGCTHQQVELALSKTHSAGTPLLSQIGFESAVSDGPDVLVAAHIAIEMTRMDKPDSPPLLSVLRI